ncbi:uncharacterized protein LOC129571798, partial [Sitodiplosis mosellana]|uniref:uncharacterized protein LOC129571798 n=1 Tax=Sitodiplosis mosellana TaxID=263140 RepID=UPI002444E07F
MKVVTSDLPSRRVTPQDWPHIHGLVLADPTYFEPGKIDLLIGSEWSASIMLPDTRIGQPNHPIARNTYFGWILHGQTASISKPNSANNQKVTIRTHHTSIDLTSLFHDFIEAERIPQEKSHTEEEKWFMDFFKQTHHRQPNGKYMVRLPFKSYNLGRSHQIGVNWFHRLERRFNRVEGLRERYEAAPAPAIAISVMHQIANDEKENFPHAESILKQEMYVDDVQSGGHSIESALAKRDDLIGALKSAGMELRKWGSNHPSLLSSIPIEHQSINSALEFNTDETVKTLGMIWQPGTDQFKYKLRFEPAKIATKRAVLSTTARLYDPLGYIAPVVVVAKIILKRIWGHNSSTHNDAQSNQETALNWDDVLPESRNELWNKFLVELPDIEKISIPRWIQFAPNQIQSIELHAFCDGATSAYAANVYIRMQYSNGLVHTHLLIAKSKVTPTKPLNIPRIELCGAELATRLAVWVKSNLQISVDQIPIYFWCDATVVLHWIHGDISRWKTYVANRISKILSSTSPKQWSHVGTHDNPADCATRGLTPTQLSKFDLWWKGPEWLVKSKKDWPTFKPGVISFSEDLAEVKSSEIHVHVSIQTESIMFLYSSLYKLIRVNAWIRRFRHNALNKLKRMQGELTVAEIQSSLFQLVRLVQAEAF